MGFYSGPRFPPPLAELPDAVGRKLSAAARDMPYSRGDVLVRVGERCDPGLVTEGLLRYSLRSEDGRSATVRYVSRGDAFGFESLFHPMSHAVIAMTACQVTHLDRELVDELSRKHASIARWVVEEMAELVTTLNSAAAGLTFKRVGQRVAEQLLILESFNRLGKPAEEIQLTHQQLADAVGSVREVVARVIRDLRERRIVETSHQGIRIIDRPGLYLFAAEVPANR